MTRLRGIVCGLLAALTLTVGGTAGAKAGDIPAGARVFSVMLTTDPDTLDPARATDTNSNHVIQQLFEGLVRVNQQNELEPALADRWTVSDDGRTYSFHIREGVRFHSGRAVTAHDFAYSLNRCLADPRSTVNETYLGDIIGAQAVIAGETTAADGIRALDDRTLELRIDASKPYFLAKLTYPTAFVVDREAVELHGERWAELGPVGTGPFRFVEWRQSQYVLLERFDGYWEGPAQVEYIEMRVTSDYTTRLSRYESGAAHFTDIQTSDLEGVQRNPRLASHLRVVLRPAVFYIGMNGERDSTFASPWVRQAFALAIDRQAIAQTVLRGVTQATTGILPPFIPGHDPAYPGMPFDPALAKAFLERAGYGPENPFPTVQLFFAAQYADVPRVMEAVQQMLQRNLGITVRLERLEWNTLLDRNRRRDLGFYSLNWWADYLDPQNFLSILLHSQSQNNNVEYHNLAFDWLLEEADVEQDAPRREALYRLADRVAVEDAPWVPIYYGYYLLLVSPEVTNFPVNLMGFMPYHTVRMRAGS